MYLQMNQHCTFLRVQTYVWYKKKPTTLAGSAETERWGQVWHTKIVTIQLLHGHESMLIRIIASVLDGHESMHADQYYSK